MPVTVQAGGSTLNTVVQVIFGIVVVAILYVITLIVLNVDAIVSQKSVVVRPREMTTIMDGWASSSYLAKMSFNTINAFSDNFRKIGKSINTSGGAQFTYQFWMRIENTDNEAFKDQVILLKGDNRKYKTAKYDMTTKKRLTNSDNSDYMIKCPLIKFGDSYKELKVQINTNKIVDYEIPIISTTSTDANIRQNVMSLLPLNWFLFTFVFEDNYSTLDSAENGIRFNFYLNDFPQHQIQASSDIQLRNNFLKQNEGDLHILPTMVNSNDFIKLANIRYYNYALTHKNVADVYARGPPSHSAVLTAKNKSKPDYLSAYNKMDIYNY
jgi:hypothetical protein